jgi:hypothetical protein
MPAMEGVGEASRWVVVADAQREVWSGSRQAPPWM